MENGFSQREAGELIADIKYLKVCCEQVNKELETIRSRNTTILTSLILLLAGTVVNIIITYAK
jgi:hypothetical protein